MADNKDKKNTPAWKDHQGEETKPQNNEDRAKKADTTKSKLVSVKMKTDYRGEVKAGEVYKTDADKADELVRLGRAEYVK